MALSANASFAHDTIKPSLYLLTCGTSNSLYASFGHTAIRYRSQAEGVDLVFNFGTFNPDEPNFYLKFFRGKADYFLSEISYQDFIEEYKAENRTIWEQELKLPEKAVSEIYDSLRILLLPENRFYRYDFFRNNCTTRVRDLLINKITEHPVLDSLQEFSGETWRQALKSGFEGRPWFSAAINLLAGPFTDKEITRLERMFLPGVFMNELCFLGISGTPMVIFRSTEQPSTGIPFFTPLLVFWILLVLFVAEAFWLNTSLRFSARLDQVIFGLSAITGLVYLSLWLWSGHISMKFNLNILWANPFNLLVVWSIGSQQIKFSRVYLVLILLLNFFLIINFTRLPQRLPFEIMPVITLLAFRAANQVFRFKVQKNVNN